MSEIVSSSIGLITAGVKTLLPDDAEKFGSEKAKTRFTILISLILLVLLQLFVGKYLWNNYLTRLVPAVQPAEGMIDILALSVLFRLLFN
jgi:hypothetical protein